MEADTSKVSLAIQLLWLPVVQLFYKGCQMKLEWLGEQPYNLDVPERGNITE